MSVVSAVALCVALLLSGCGSGPETGAYLVDVRDGTRSRVASGDEATWLPDGKRLLVWNQEEGRVVDADGAGGKAMPLANPAEGSLTVAGDRVVYVATNPRGVELATGDLVAQDLGSAERRTIFRRATGTPVVSPDRRSVVIQRRIGDETDGGSRARTFRVDLDTGAARATPELDGVFLWLENGLMLAKRRRDGDSDVVLLRYGKVDSTVVPDERSAVFSASPDGRRLAIAGPIGGGDTYRLYVVDLERGLPRRISDGVYAGVAWAPDGRSLAVYTFGGQVFTMRPDGSRRRAIARFPDLDVQALGWSRDGRRLSVVTTEQFRSD